MLLMNLLNNSWYFCYSYQVCLLLLLLTIQLVSIKTDVCTTKVIIKLMFPILLSCTYIVCYLDQIYRQRKRCFWFSDSHLIEYIKDYYKTEVETKAGWNHLSYKFKHSTSFNGSDYSNQYLAQQQFCWICRGLSQTFNKWKCT